MARSRSIGGIYASLSLRDGAFTSGMKRAGKQLKAFGGAAVKYGAIAASAMSAALVVMAKRSVSAASDLSETMSKSDVVFGKNSEAMKAWAATGAKAFGQSKQEALGAASTMGNMFIAMGLGADKASDMSKSMVELAADLASFNNTSSDDALQAIGAGLRGESEPLRRYGVLLDDATLKAEALAQGLYNGKGSLTPVSRAMAAYGVILKQTTTAQGDFGRTSDGLANAQRIIVAQLANATAEIGRGLLPAVENLANAAKKIDFEGIGAKIGDELAWGLTALTDGKAWELFALYGEQALLGLQMSPIINGIAAEIGGMWDAIQGKPPNLNRLQDQLEGTTDKLLEIQDRIDEINAGIGKTIAGRTKIEIAGPPSPAIEMPSPSMDASSVAAELAAKAQAAVIEVNDYQKRGLSLGSAQVSKQETKQIDLMTQMRDYLKKLSEKNGQLLWGGT